MYERRIQPSSLNNYPFPRRGGFAAQTSALLSKDKQLGIEQGIEQGKLDMVKHFLLAGFDEQEICKALKERISKD